jgi:hypothetical protein
MDGCDGDIGRVTELRRTELVVAEPVDAGSLPRGVPPALKYLDEVLPVDDGVKSERGRLVVAATSSS